MDFHFSSLFWVKWNPLRTFQWKYLLRGQFWRSQCRWTNAQDFPNQPTKIRWTRLSDFSTHCHRSSELAREGEGECKLLRSKMWPHRSFSSSKFSNITYLSFKTNPGWCSFAGVFSGWVETKQMTLSSRNFSCMYCHTNTFTDRMVRPFSLMPSAMHSGGVSQWCLMSVWVA